LSRNQDTKLSTPNMDDNQNHGPASAASAPAKPVPAWVLGAAIFSLVAVVVVGAWLASRHAPTSMAAAQLAQPADSPERFGEVKPFQLVERSGRPVAREDLLGKPWVVGFIFTRCTGPCPKISGNMRALSEKLAGVDARLVTISVDPEHDTPEVLAEYARRLGADESRWLFLTGTPEAVRSVSVDSFMLPVERDPSAPVGQLVTHRTVLAVVDSRGNVRGYYDGEGEDGVSLAAARAAWLAKEGR
jgi:cytochrome oxidase Cu insertion factor (SCO1/SenC/PrrC family)